MLILVLVAVVVAVLAAATGRARPRPTLVVAALVVSVATAVLVATAVGDGDDWARWVVAVPPSIAAFDLVASRRGGAALHTAAVVAYASFVVVTGLSIGIVFLPGLALLTAAGWAGATEPSPG